MRVLYYRLHDRLTLLPSDLPQRDVSKVPALRRAVRARMNLLSGRY